MTDPLAPETVETAMARQLDDWLEVLTGLIQRPSETPPGDTREVADFLMGVLDDRDLRYEVIAPETDKPNIVAQVEGTNGDPAEGRHLVYNGHLDTLRVGDESHWDRDPFSGAVADGRVWGRGAADMYGGLTASLAAFAYLAAHRDAFQGRLTFTAVSDEETGGEWGAKYLVENYPAYHGDALLNGEPSANNVIRFGERGLAWIEVRVDGDPGAGAYVGGTNPIETLCRLLLEIAGIEESGVQVTMPAEANEVIRAAAPEYDRVWGEGATDRVLQLTTNIGVIEGGEVGAVNVTPGTAMGQVDIRLPIGTSVEGVLERIETIADDFAEHGTVEVDCFRAFDPTYSDVDHELFQQLQRQAGRVRDGAEPVFACALAGTDCRFWRNQGVPCAVYGPTPHNVGGENEHIFVDDFEEVLKAQAMASAAYLSA